MEEAGGAEYPKTLYRDGGEKLLWGFPIIERVVLDADEERGLLGEGWRLQPIGELTTAKPADAPASAGTDKADLEAAAQLLAEIEAERDALKARVATLETENAALQKQMAAFDHDGDGAPGGGKPRRASG